MPDRVLWALDEPLRTERLLLRVHQRLDLDDLVEFHSNADVTRYIPWPVRDREQTRAALEVKLGQGEARAEGEWLVLAMELAAGASVGAAAGMPAGKVIGEVLLKRESDAELIGELGYAVHQDFQGQGFGSEAAVAMLTLAWEHLGLARVVAYVDERNAASVSLLTKLGFEPGAPAHDGALGFTLERP